MKMLFVLPVAESGTIHLIKPAGVFVEAGETLGRLVLDDPSLVAKAQPFDGDIGNIEPPAELSESTLGSPPHQQVAYLIGRSHNMLDGCHR